jgi:AraC family transcriptional regulator
MRSPIFQENAIYTKCFIPSIQVLRDGNASSAAPDNMLLTSSQGLFKGVLLEQPHLPPGELDGVFTSTLIGLNLGDAYWQDWRTEGKKGRVLIPTGGVSLCSAQEVWCRWDRPRTFIAVAFQPDTMEECMYEVAPPRVELKSEPNIHDPVIESFILAMYAEVRTGCVGGPLRGEAIASDLAAYLQRQYSVRPVKSKAPRGVMSRARLRQVIDYIESSMQRELHVAELASIAGMSPWYFGKLFRQSTGWSVHQYVAQRRFQRALRLLREGTLPISMVGASVGVTNQSQFARFFRQQLGTTPRRYREEFS